MEKQLRALEKEATDLEKETAALALTHEKHKRAGEEIRQAQRQKEKEIEAMEREWFGEMSKSKEAADNHNDKMRRLTEVDLLIKDLKFEMAVADNVENNAKPFIEALTPRIEAYFANRAESFLKDENPVAIDDIVEEFKACLGFQGTRGGLGEATRRAEKNYQQSLKDYFKELLTKGKSEAEPFNRKVQAELDALLRNQFVQEMINGKRAIS